MSDTQWERIILIESLAPASYEGWLDEIPTNAEVGLCREEVRYSSQLPEPNSQEVCGEPYTVDTGTGVGELVQDCEYLVFDEACQYTVNEWQVIGQQAESGSNLSPIWPVLSLDSSQREGEYEESYQIVFDTDGSTYTYRPSTTEEYTRFEVGSDWILEINGFNAIVDIQPR